MSDYGATDTTTTTLGTNQFPVSAVFVPGDSKLTTLEGGNKGTDGNGKTSASASMLIKDGNDVTQGSASDANTVSSVMGRLTKIRDLLSAALTVSGTITANAGTNLNTSALALETGGNLASAKTDLDNINTAIGAVSDAAYSGSGNGSEIALLKKIVAELAATLTVSGSVAVSNFPGTQPVSGSITATQATGTNLHTVVDSGAITATTNADTTIGGTVAPTKELLIAGKTNDGTPQYQPLPEGAGGRSVIVEGIAGGTAQPVSGTVTANIGTAGTLALESGGNLATLAGIVSSSKAAVKAASGDFADGSIATIGALADAAVTNPAASGSAIALLKGLLTRIGSTLGFDNTSRLQTSLYGKNSAAGDTAIKVNGNGDQYVLGDFTESASLSAGSLNADLVASLDVSAYKWFSIHVNTSAFVGTLTIQGSNDNVNFPSCFAYNIASGSLSTTIASTNQLLAAAISFRYLRIRMTSYTSGTAQAVLELYTSPAGWLGTTSAQSGNWNVNIRDTGAATINSNGGALNVSLAHSNAVVAANTAGNTVIKASAGVLATVTVTTLGTVGLTFFDNASTNSGTPLLVIPASAPVGTIYQLNGPATLGIVAAGVANCPGLTVYYC